MRLGGMDRLALMAGLAGARPVGLVLHHLSIYYDMHVVTYVSSHALRVQYTYIVIVARRCR